MKIHYHAGLLFLGGFIFLGLSALGYFISDAAVDYKRLERSVTVKGLAEKELKADVVIWPIQFTITGNGSKEVYLSLDQQLHKIQNFLKNNGIVANEITASLPTITDRIAQNYSNASGQFRYTASQTVTVYSKRVDAIRNVMNSMSELGKKGIVLTGNNYGTQIEYIFTSLNEIKPEMIQEATHKARLVAEKFAEDSSSALGKIKRASQGQFSISDRDKNNPHIKRVRVVSTIEYYLSD